MDELDRLFVDLGAQVPGSLVPDHPGTGQAEERRECGHAVVRGEDDDFLQARLVVEQAGHGGPGQQELGRAGRAATCSTTLSR